MASGAAVQKIHKIQTGFIPKEGHIWYQKAHILVSNPTRALG